MRMNSIDVKSLIIGALLTAVVFLSTGWQAPKTGGLPPNPNAPIVMPPDPLQDYSPNAPFVMPPNPFQDSLHSNKPKPLQIEIVSWPSGFGSDLNVEVKGSRFSTVPVKVLETK